MPSWTIFDMPWPVSALCILPIGETIEGTTNVNGNLVRLTWNGATLPLASPALPLNAMALDQAAADILSTQFPELLYLLRAQSPAVIRQLVNV
jgi:hypothetical protein